MTRLVRMLPAATLAAALVTSGAAGEPTATREARTPNPAAVQPAESLAVRGLPLVELPAQNPESHVLALVLSGDGDWAPFIRGASEALAANGISVVGLKARSYLSRHRTPDETARDAAEILRYYLSAWKKDQIIVVGYSRGADMGPFVVHRLPPDLRSRVRLLAMAGPGRMASFEFHLLDLVRDTPRPTDIPTLPEVQAIQGIPMICVYGAEEEDSLCPAAPAGLMQVVSRPGGHHDPDPGQFASLILAELRKSPLR